MLGDCVQNAKFLQNGTFVEEKSTNGKRKKLKKKKKLAPKLQETQANMQLASVGNTLSKKGNKIQN